MAGYEIGISGLHAAQLALDVVGNNLANGATEGYHRQTVDLRPLEDVFTGGHQIGQGVSWRESGGWSISSWMGKLSATSRTWRRSRRSWRR